MNTRTKTNTPKNTKQGKSTTIPQTSVPPTKQPVTLEVLSAAMKKRLLKFMEMTKQLEAANKRIAQLEKEKKDMRTDSGSDDNRDWLYKGEMFRRRKTSDYFKDYEKYKIEPPFTATGG